MTPKLTCLMPTYNKESTLAKAIESVIMQETGYSYKLIILDDSSTDNSNKIAKDYQNKFPHKIEVVENSTNQGLLKTIVKGYSLLKGSDYFCVLDADDWYIYNKKFDNAIKFLEENPDFSLYMTNVNLVKKDSVELLVNTTEKYKDFSLQDLRLGKAFFVQTSGVVYRNVYFKEGMHQKFLEATKGKYGEYLRADGFRQEWYLHSGKAHFVNHVESVYNWTDSGIYASLRNDQRLLVNIRLSMACADFFVEDDFYYFAKVYGIFKTFFETTKCINLEYVDVYVDFLNKIYSTKDYYRRLGFTKNIVFFMPSRRVGGYQTCFMNFARYLSENVRIKVYYIDYDDGFVAHAIKGTKIKLIKYKENKKISVPVHSTIFTPITLALQDKFKLKNDVKLLFWWAHPLAGRWLIGRSGKTEETINNFLNHVHLNNAVYPMDDACKKSMIKVIPNSDSFGYIPVPVRDPVCDYNDIDTVTSKDEINIAWLGRIDADKINSILNILRNFDNYETPKKKNIHIIGGGACEDMIKPNDYESLQIKMLGRIVGKELDLYLSESVDILFGMGASLLEAAKVGVPSVLVKFSNTEFDDDSYVYLYDLKNYILGIDDYEYVDQSEIRSMKMILDDIYVRSQKKYLGYKCYRHYVSHHSVSFCSSMLINKLSVSKLNLNAYNEFEGQLVNNSGKGRVLDRTMSYLKSKIRYFFQKKKNRKNSC